MGDSLLVNLDSLVDKAETSLHRKNEPFEMALRMCHAKIDKESKMGRQETVYRPPAFIFGKSFYDYTEMIEYLLNSLKANGLYAIWIPSQKNIYISWKKTDINLDVYRKRTAKEGYQTYHQLSDNQLPIVTGTIANTSTPESLRVDNVSKRDGIHVVSVAPKPQETKKKGPPPMTHAALIEYGPGMKDLVPINVKALKKH